MPALERDALLSNSEAPPTVTTCSTPGVLRAIAVTRAIAFCVRSRDAPSGSCVPTSR